MRSKPLSIEPSELDQANASTRPSAHNIVQDITSILYRRSPNAGASCSHAMRKDADQCCLSSDILKTNLPKVSSLDHIQCYEKCKTSNLKTDDRVTFAMSFEVALRVH